MNTFTAEESSPGEISARISCNSLDFVFNTIHVLSEILVEQNHPAGEAIQRLLLTFRLDVN